MSHKMLIPFIVKVSVFGYFPLHKSYYYYYYITTGIYMMMMIRFISTYHRCGHPS